LEVGLRAETTGPRIGSNIQTKRESGPNVHAIGSRPFWTRATAGWNLRRGPSGETRDKQDKQAVPLEVLGFGRLNEAPQNEDLDALLPEITAMGVGWTSC
jgi:hypothetical protein